MPAANVALMHELLGLLKGIPDCRMVRRADYFWSEKS